ncbi:MAG: response regulator [Proteobacteria bacterium]|nr:response regulator [Pseudomonadota bacterium]MDA1057667.1 response regulator [Pseudomonadota bacterium]
MTTDRKLEILLVEDDEVDRMAVRRAFKELGVSPKIIETRDGEEAISLLEGRTDAPRPVSPYLILLDINMPRMTGHEFMEQLRASKDPTVANAVVFVLSTSAAEKDIKEAYARNVAGYLVKSDYLDGLKPVVQMIKTFGEVVQFP